MNEIRAREIGFIRHARCHKEGDEADHRNDDWRKERVEFGRLEKHLTQNIKGERQAEPEGRVLFKVRKSVKKEIHHVNLRLKA